MSFSLYLFYQWAPFLKYKKDASLPWSKINFKDYFHFLIEKKILLFFAPNPSCIFQLVQNNSCYRIYFCICSTKIRRFIFFIFSLQNIPTTNFLHIYDLASIFLNISICLIYFFGCNFYSKTYQWNSNFLLIVFLTFSININYYYYIWYSSLFCLLWKDWFLLFEIIHTFFRYLYVKKLRGSFPFVLNSIVQHFVLDMLYLYNVELYYFPYIP